MSDPFQPHIWMNTLDLKTFKIVVKTEPFPIVLNMDTVQ